MILPRKDKDGKPYISYSQISSFLRDKKEYMKNYFFGEPIQFTAYIDHGQKIGRALEANDFSGFSPKEAETLKKVPRLDIFEKNVKVDFGNFYLTGFIDTIDKKFTKLHDYKVGTEKKIAEYEDPKYIQTILYAMGIKQETGKLPKHSSVILIDRKGNAFKGEPLVIGDQIWEIPLEISQKRIKFADELVRETANEISKYYQVFLKMNK